MPMSSSNAITIASLICFSLRLTTTGLAAVGNIPAGLAATNNLSQQQEPMRKVQYFDNSVDTHAAALWKAIAQQPFRASNRRSLADHYRRRGFVTLARFVDATADVLVHDAVTLPRPGKEIAWACPPHGKDVYGDVDMVDAELAHGDLNKAAATLAKLLAARKACPLLFEWAYVSLHLLVSDPDAFSWDDRERAIRTAITAIEEVNEGHGKAAYTYDLIAGYNALIGDVPTAYIAALTGRNRSGPDRSVAYAKQQDELISKLHLALVVARTRAK